MEASFTVTHVGSRFCPVYVQQWSNYVDYDVLNNTCGFLGPGQTCTFRVRFAPTDVGPLPTQIMVRPQHGYGGTVELSGTGVIASR
jgi:hypothetical protein